MPADFTSRVFGRLTVISQETSSALGVPRWKCRCECGGETTARGPDLTRGHTKSCGCLGAANRLGNAGFRKGLNGHFPGILLVDALFQPKHFDDLLAHGVQRIQRCHRLLEDHGDIATADAPEPPLGNSHQVFRLPL